MPIADYLNYAERTNPVAIEGNILANQNMGLTNALLGQQVENEPYRQELLQAQTEIKRAAIAIREQALLQSQKEHITLPYGEFDISGNPKVIAPAAEKIMQYSGQINQDLFPWLAQQGITVKRREPKEWKPGSKEEAKEVAEWGAGNKSKTEEQLTQTALFDNDPVKREQARQILDTMQKRKIETVKNMPATQVYLGTDAEGNPLLTGGTKGKPEIKKGEVPGGGKIGPKPSKLPAEEQKSLQSLSELVKTSDEIEKMFKGVESKIGPIAGRWNVVKSKFVDNADFVEFKATLGQLRTIVYGISGKQINESELDWLKNDILPALESPGKNFLATLKAFRNWSKKKHEALNEQYKTSGYITGAESQVPKTIGRFTIEVE